MHITNVASVAVRPSGKPICDGPDFTGKRALEEFCEFNADPSKNKINYQNPFNLKTSELSQTSSLCP